MTRIWNDSAMRKLPLWLTITMLNTSVLLGVVLWRQAANERSQEPPVVQLLAILWLAISVYMLAGDVRTRCQRLEMTLPIPAKALWRNHQMAVVAAGSLVMAGSLGVLVFHSLMLSNVGRERVLDIPYLTLIGPLVGGLVLAASLIGLVEPDLWKLRGRRSYWVLVTTSLVGILVFLILLQEKPWLTTTLCLMMGAAINWMTLRQLPPAYRLVPHGAAAACSEVAIAASSAQPVSRWQIIKILVKVLHTTPPWKQFTPWLLYIFVALMGFILAGGLVRWINAQDLRFFYIPMGSYMILAGVGILTYHLYRFDPLPIPRRTLFAVITLPGLLIFCAGYLAGRLAVTTDPDPAPLVDYKVLESREAGTMVWVEVDQAFLGASPSGEVPTLSSPWGESHEAWSQEVFPGLSPVLFSSYNTAEETTADFEALMASRAIRDVYGTTIAPKTIRSRYFVVENNRVVGLREGGFALLADYPDLEAPPAVPETPIYLMLVMVPALLLMAVFVRSFRATHSNSYIRGIYWVTLGVLLGALIGQVVLSLFGIFNPEAGRGFLAVFIHRMGSTPLLFTMTWLISVGAILGSYWLALRQFEQAEIPAAPVNCTLMSFSGAD